MKAMRAGLAVLCVAGAAAAQGRPEFGADDNGREVRLATPVFDVSLPVNAGTGYRWELDTAQSRGVQLLARGPGPAPPHGAGIVGFPASTRFTLRATSPRGEVRIALLPPGRNREPDRTWRLAFRTSAAVNRLLPIGGRPQ